MASYYLLCVNLGTLLCMQSDETGQWVVQLMFQVAMHGDGLPIMTCIP